MTDKLEKLTAEDGKSLDLEAQNIEQLKLLFPDVFREDKVDFDALKAVLGEHVEDKEERYNFTWHGKNKARQIAQTPSTGTLRPHIENSVNWSSTQNLFIEGDNLEVLKLLQKSYHQKVKIIYIDPPYNTGNDFVYRDNFTDNIENYLSLTSQTSLDGTKKSANSETSGRYHTDWLNMIYPRLKLARNLLTEDGLIFISIDENEVANLKKVCDEIFGEDNFYCSFVWQRRSGSMDSTDGVSIDHEYVLCFGKMKNRLHGVKRTFDKYSNPDDDPRGPWISDNLSAGKAGGNVYYPIHDPATGNEFYPPKGRYWPYNPESMAKKISEGRVIFPSSPEGRPMLKRFQNEAKSLTVPVSSLMRNHTEKKLPNNVIVSAMNTFGTSEIQKLFDGKVFSFPKSTVLIKSLISQILSPAPNDIILDFFAGSASTADAVMQLNEQDGGNRRFIMVQIPEPTPTNSDAFKAGYKNLSEISRARIVKAGMDKSDQIDIGFKYFTLDSTNIKPWEGERQDIDDLLENSIDSIKDKRSSDDVLYEILLKYGLDLSYSIQEISIADKQVFNVAYGSLIVCLEDNITLDTVKGIGVLKAELESESTRVVFKDTGFADDAVKVNAVQLLKQYGIYDVKSI